MSEIVIETTPQEIIIEVEGGPVLTTTVEQELQTVVEVPAEPVVIDLNSGARGEPGSAILTGEAYPTLLMGSVGDIFVVTDGIVGVGDVYIKTVDGWEKTGNIRGPVGGIESVNNQFGPTVVLDKVDVGLSEVDNTADLNKPVSTATQTALDTKSDVGHLHPISDVTGLQDELDTTVRLTGAQTIAGTKTFSNSPIVPNSSFTISKTQSLQATLDEKVTLATAQTIASRKAFHVDSTDATAISGATIEVRNDTGNPRVAFHKNLVRLAQIRMLDSGTFEFANSAGTGLVDVSAAVITASTGFSGPGGSLTGLNATNLSSGTVSDARLSSNVALLDNAQTVTGAKTFTGEVIVPTPTASNHAVTKAYIDAIVDAAPGTLDTLNELAAALGDDPNFATTVSNNIATKVTLTGNETIDGVKTFNSAPLVPDNSWTISDTSGLQAELDLKAPLANPTFTGTASGTFSGNGAALTSLNGSSISTGTVDDARLSANIPKLASANTFTDRVIVSSADTGTTYSTAPLEIRQTSTGVPRISFHKTTVNAAQIRMTDAGNFEFANIGDTAFASISALNITATGTISGSGSGITALNGSNISTGTVADARIATSIARLASPAFTGTPTAPTAATTDNDTQLATTAFVKAALLAAHPVGDIKFTTQNVNPSTYLGGTWVAWGAGRVPVGVDTAQTEFDTVEETGGAKTHTLTVTEMPSHTHVQNAHTHTQNAHGHSISDPGHGHVYYLGYNEDTAAHNWAFNDGSVARRTFVVSSTWTTNSATTGITIANATATNQNTTATNQNTGGGGAHNNLQPYITCYMWKRTA